MPTMKIDFEFTTTYGVFRDALHLDSNREFSEAEIMALKQERLNNWLYAIENPPASEAEIVELGGVQYQKIETDGRIELKPLED